jgi:D-alanine-D-alanine ligase
MRRLRVAVLTHEDLIPPDSLEGLEPKQIQRFRTEYDVAQAVEALGHQVQIAGASSDLAPIRDVIRGWRPHVVFNLLMEFRDVGALQVHVASYLELLAVAYTGCNPRGILLSRDKDVSKKILRFHRIPTPAFAVFRRGRSVRLHRGISFPLIVKTVDEEASLGIAQASVVHDEQGLRERAEFIHESLGADAIAEEYVHGRELTIGVLGNERLQTLPIWEMVFEKLPEGSLPIATERAKWDLAYRERTGIGARRAGDLPEGVERQIARMARRAYRALGLSGYARMDLRLREDGRPFLIEANATPDVAREEDLAQAALATGLGYEALIQRILGLGLRYRPRWASTST